MTDGLSYLIYRTERDVSRSAKAFLLSLDSVWWIALLYPSCLLEHAPSLLAASRDGPRNCRVAVTTR
jgi:hypothetical protein